MDRREKEKARHRAFYLEHREEIKARSKKYREEHKEKCAKYSQEYRKKNKKRLKEYKEKWDKENEDYLREYRKRYQDAHREEHYARVRKYAATHREKMCSWAKAQQRRTNWATDKVLRAIKKGIMKKQPCEICGVEPAEAHHDDYNFPLEVRWLCKKHHVEWHQHNKPIYYNE